jgi:hypothetical protein
MEALTNNITLIYDLVTINNKQLTLLTRYEDPLHSFQHTWCGFKSFLD